MNAVDSKCTTRETASSTERGNRASITISGTKENIDAIRASLLGAAFVRVNDQGDVERHDRYQPLPDPIQDPATPVKWQLDWLKTSNPNRFDVAGVLPPDEWHSPGIIVSHLCGYGWSKSAYDYEVRKLQSWGFELMRSRRGDNGRFWELWWLPYLLAAQGDLKAFIDGLEKDVRGNWAHETRAIVGWLCRHASFGCLDVTVQRAAMVME